MKILLIIVLYGQRLQQTNTYRTLLREHAQMPLFIYDNSPEPQHSADEFDSTSITYLSNPTNPGLGVAYNCAARHAQSLGMEWMLLLDQDTHFAPHIIDAYRKAVEQHPQIVLFAPPMKVDGQRYLSPVRTHGPFTRLARQVPTGIASLDRYTPINSGMLIRLDAFRTAGGYNEAVMLDYADYEFVGRLRQHFHEFYVLQAECRQEFSNETTDRQAKLKRFELFCRSIRNCQRRNRIDHAAYLLLVLKRALSLSIGCKTLQPIGIFIKNYL